jgi:hypothetical protein
MALTRISGNQISTTTSAIINTLSFANTTSIMQLPTGTTAQRPAGVTYGTIRFNTTIDNVEVFKSDSDGQGTDGWGAIGGGGPSRGRDSIIRTNRNYINENISIGTSAGETFANGMSSGPITIQNGFTVTIETGANWSIV